MCAASYLITGYLSDDLFSDFKAALISLGRDTLDQALTNPHGLADLPIVQAIATGHADRSSLLGKSIHAAAAHAYGARTGGEEDF